MASEVQQAGTDRTPRGVDACKQQERQGIADAFVPQRLSFEQCLEKEGNEILPLGGRPAALVELFP